jgi:hypothetical protein
LSISKSDVAPFWQSDLATASVNVVSYTFQGKSEAGFRIRNQIILSLASRNAGLRLRDLQKRVDRSAGQITLREKVLRLVKETRSIRVRGD